MKLFKLTHGRFPRKSGGEADETKLYYWMWACTDETRNMWTQERARALNRLYGDRRMETFELAPQNPASSVRGKAIPHNHGHWPQPNVPDNMLRTSKQS